MEENLTMADFMDAIDKSMKRIRRGDIKTAKVVSVENDYIVADIDYHQDALIPWNEYSYEEVDKNAIKPGDTFQVAVVKVDNEEGNVIVSKRRAEASVAWEKVEELFKQKAQFTVKIKEVVKGGVTATVAGVRGFIPGSQLTAGYVEDLQAFVGQDVMVEIIECDREKRKLVLSGKAIAREKQQQERQAKLDSLVEGEKYAGTVTKLMPYGAFVDLGGVEGLIHNSDLSWARVRHPGEVVKEGEKVQVTVTSLDKEKRKIGLCLKDVEMDPWILATAILQEGDVVKGKVSKLMTFGAFVEIAEYVEGLVHISQIADKRINKPDEVLAVGETVEVKILSIDKANKKISLSIKAAKQEAEQLEEAQTVSEYQQVEEEQATLGDVMGSAFSNLDEN